MNKQILLAGLPVLISSMAMASELSERMPKRLPLLNETVFYDGYQPVIVDADADDGILRHSNSLYAVKLSEDQLASVGSHLGLEITLGALCDNYDRIGNTMLAFVPKGSETYAYGDVDRIEIARFITPFMNKNFAPREVPFVYDLTGVDLILRDPSIREKYDIWFEFEVFGIPYAANQQVSGCEGRQDVFQVTADFLTDETPSAPVQGHILLPIYMKRPEYHGNINFNNYKEGACDTIGVTTRTFEIDLPRDVEDSKVVFIMTNHGAAKGGEEYIRRLHLVYFDDELKMTYTPGGVSCEPYRKYNTQSNGIYGTFFRGNSYWETYSNWCPGQAVPVREINTGMLKAGRHRFMIRVPDAEFAGNDGDFRPSIYFQGLEKGTLPISVRGIEAEADITLTPEAEGVAIGGGDKAVSLSVYSAGGELLYGTSNPGDYLDLSGYAPGVYMIVAVNEQGATAFTKIIR